MSTNSLRAVLAIFAGCLAGGCALTPHHDADVIVVGGTPGGISAAVAAAREGRSVILVEPTRHVGGIVASGLTNVDIIKKNAVGGIYQEFVERVRSHYEKTYGPQSPQYKACREGHHFEPKIAEAMFLSLLKEQEPHLRVLYQYRLARAEVNGKRLTAVVFDDLASGRQVRLSAQAFIDATYEGDLAAMAGVRYRVGRESRAEYGEAHAGTIYTRFRHDEFLPGSTGEGDAGIQAFCFRFMLTKNSENKVPVRKPPSFNRDDYKHLLADFRAGRIKSLRQAIQFFPLPNDRFEINSNHCEPDSGAPSESLDLAEEVWLYPDADYAQRQKIFKRVWNYQEGLIWLLQNDPEIPEKMRAEAAQLGFCKDEFTDNDNRPWQMYVRQGRRIFGEYRLTENDGKLDPALGRTKVQPTSIAIAEYPFDSHAVHKFDPAHPGVREGYIYIAHEPIQIPYGVIVPEKIDGLLVPVACSATHVGYQTIRMEPVFMQLGQAAGIAAILSCASGEPPRKIAVQKMQDRLARAGGVITFFEDLKFEDPEYAAIQRLGTLGLNRGYTADPDKQLTRREGWEALGRVLHHGGITWPSPEDVPEAPLRREDLVAWLRQAGLTPATASIARAPQDNLRVRDVARIVYETLSGGS